MQFFSLKLQSLLRQALGDEPREFRISFRGDTFTAEKTGQKPVVGTLPERVAYMGPFMSWLHEVRQDIITTTFLEGTYVFESEIDGLLAEYRREITRYEILYQMAGLKNFSIWYNNGSGWYEPELPIGSAWAETPEQALDSVPVYQDGQVVTEFGVDPNAHPEKILYKR